MRKGNKGVNENIVYTLGNGNIERGERTILSLLNQFFMSEKVLIQTIDSLIESLEAVLTNRCSLSDQDRNIFSKALTDLRVVKQKKGRTNDEILQVIESVIKIFL